MRWLFLPVLFQTQASVGLGVGTVRYAGGSRLAVASVSPNLRFVSPMFESNLGSTLAALSGKTWFAQGRADVWAATAPLANRWRLGGEGICTGTTLSHDGWTAALHALAEVLWVQPSWGIAVGAGPSAGWSPERDTSGTLHQTSVTGLHTRARAWWGAGGASWAASVEPTRFLGAWFTDFAASVTVDRDRLSATASSVLRTSGKYASSAAASALIRFSLSPSAALELGGGSGLRDPYQGFPRAGFVTAAIRLVRPRAAGLATEPTFPSLIPQTHGDTITVRFQMPGAAAVAIAGDWNAWAPVPLTAVGNDVWSGALRLGPGTYHFNLLVDGKEWVVPRGVATVPDGLGGIVGVLIVN